MVKAVNMPQVGQDLETAKIIEWHIKEGDEVNEGDILATVESDKASFEVESFQKGTVIKLLFKEGDEATVFKPIAYIGDTDDFVPSEDEKGKEENKTEAPKTASSENVFKEETGITTIFASPSARRLAKEKNLDLRQLTGSGPNGRVILRDIPAHSPLQDAFKITPVARKIAKSQKINLANITGTGTGGRIQKSDVLKSTYSDIPPLSIHAEDEIIRFDRVRKIIADRLSLSKQTIPHYYLGIDVELEAALKLKERLMEDPGIKVSLNDVLIHTIAAVLRHYPNLNAHVGSDKMVLKKDINVGVAVSTDKGVLVPVLKNADQKSLYEVSREIKELVEDAKRGIVNPAHQGTITVSNLGMFGVSHFQAIINPPECAIISVGSADRRVLPADNGLRIIHVVNLGLAVDHRAVDGAYAAGFLKALKTRVQNI